MNKRRSKRLVSECSRCKALAKVNTRRDHIFGGVLLLDIPATYCRNCDEELYDLATVQWVEKVAAEPEKYAEMVELPVARWREGLGE